MKNQFEGDWLASFKFKTS